MSAVAKMLGVGSSETVRGWLRRGQVDAGDRPGIRSETQAEIKRLSRESAELRQATEVLEAASAFFAAELHRPRAR